MQRIAENLRTLFLIDGTGNELNPGRNLTLVTKMVTKAITWLNIDQFR
jgi:hypothetical protein